MLFENYLKLIQHSMGLSRGDTKLPDYATLFLIIWEISIPTTALNVD